MRPVAVIGNLTYDVVDGRPPRVGGPPYYAARALRVLARPARVVVKCAEADREALVQPLVALGLPTTWRASSSTARFSIAYVDSAREMSIDALGDPWTPDEARGWVADALGDVVWLHVGALARSDFPAETLAELARRRRLSLDGQALVRPARTGRLVFDADFDPAVLRHLTVLKLADDEARALVGEPSERALSDLGVPEVLVTLGPRGSILFCDGALDRVPAAPAPRAVDPTGAGDMFAAAYVAGRAGGYSPASAARRASSLVADLLAGRV